MIKVLISFIFIVVPRCCKVVECQSNSGKWIKLSNDLQIVPVWRFLLINMS
ncbi:hypothetical protein PROVRETT_07199 [Providencia rettgeri DSM 1131]|nr:hypothetical protein PROVRETT_07199 [Providencia rettgeri DSM 1131]